MNIVDEEIQGRTTADRFELTCRVMEKSLSYKDTQSRGKTSLETAKVIVLVPLDGTEADCFFSAWLPERLSDAEKLLLGEKAQEYIEVVMEGGFPICGYFRGAVEWGNALHDRPHIFVMTKQAEVKLSSYVGKTIRLTTLGDGEEESRYELKAETKSPYSDVP